MEQMINDIIAELSLEEKTALISGEDFWHLAAIERLGIPSLTVADGPHGVRKNEGAKNQAALTGSLPATCFPTASATASSWDRSLLREIGNALGEECLEEGVDILLGPGVNIKRSPLCGRNFEYFSEDPLLSGELAAAWIRGVQEKGVGTSLKHFACNNQESHRMTIEAIVDERSLREIYLPAFEIAVKKAKPWTVMCAYNKVNGYFCSEHAPLLLERLKEDWEFDGCVLTDWGACDDRLWGLQVGQDIEMPSSGGQNDKNVLYSVLANPSRIAILDNAVARILRLVLRAMAGRKPGFRYDRDAHHALARRAATESMVLLKNEGGILPLTEGTKLALIGEFAEKPRYQGSGSSHVEPTRLDTVRSLIADYSPDIEYARGYDQAKADVDEALISEAVALARRSPVALVYVGLTPDYETEGLDRVHLSLPPSHERLIEAVAAANANTIVVLSNGSAVEMPWLGKVRAVLEGFLAGQAGAGASLDLIFGRACPSAKLAETFAASLKDIASTAWFPEGPLTVEYREGLYVGYRWFDTAGKEPLFPFGYGLSYTIFAYSDLRLSSPVFVGDPIMASVTVTNTGGMKGAEIVQLYVHDAESTVFRPQKELKGFARVELEPGASASLRFSLDRRCFAYWEARLEDWYVEAGDFDILVGASSADIRQSVRLHAESSHPDYRPVDRRTRLPRYYDPAKGFSVSDAEFRTLYARELPAKAEAPRLAFTLNTPLGELCQTFLGRLLYRAVRMGTVAATDGGEAGIRMAEATAAEMPLRALVSYSEGKLGFSFLRFALGLMNIGRAKRPRHLLSLDPRMRVHS